MSRAGTLGSTVDLFAGKWVLFFGPRGTAWRDLLRQTVTHKKVAVESYGIAPAGILRDEQRQFSRKYGVAEDGAVLVRPDGFVAWRRHDAAGAMADEIDAAVDSKPKAQSPKPI